MPAASRQLPPSGNRDEPHRVGQLRLHVVADRADAFAMRPRIEAFAQGRLPALIERACDRLDLGDAHLVIDRLTLDLGRIGVARFEEEATAALEAQLDYALEIALRDARHALREDVRLRPAADARRQVFADYLDTGRMPSGDGVLPLDRFLALAADDAPALVAMLRTRAGRPVVLERLVLQLGMEWIARLVAMLAPADAETILALVADTILVRRRLSPPAVRRLADPALSRILWTTTLALLLRDPGGQFNRRRFLAALLARHAASEGIGYHALLALMARALAETRARRGLRSSLPVLVAALMAESPPAPDEPGAMPPDPWIAASDGDFIPLADLVRDLDDQPLLAVADRLDAALFAGLLHALVPRDAGSILALTDAVVAVGQHTPVLRPEGLDRALRRLTLRFLRKDPGSAFNRRRFLTLLIHEEAMRAGLDEAALVRELTRAAIMSGARHGRHLSLAATLLDLLAERGDDAVVGATGDAGAASGAVVALSPAGGSAPALPDTASVLRAGSTRPMDTAQTGSPDRDGVLPRILARLRAAARLGAFDAVPGRVFEAAIAQVAAAIDHDPARATIAQLAAALGWPADALGVLALGGGDPRADAAPRVSPLATSVRALLAAGAPAASTLAVLLRGVGLHRLRVLATTLSDRERGAVLASFDRSAASRLAAMAASLARRHADAPLLPVDRRAFSALLWAAGVAYMRDRPPGGFDPAGCAAHLTAMLARVARLPTATMAARLARRAAWPGDVGAELVIARDARHERVAARFAGRRADRLTMLAAYLAAGEMPPWAPTGLTARALLGEAAALTGVELAMLFATGERTATLTRLRRAMAALDRAEGGRLLVRLAPTLAPGEALGRAIDALPRAALADARLRAAEAALNRRPFSLADLAVPLPTLAGPEPSARPAPTPVDVVRRDHAASIGRRADADRLLETVLAWLDGTGKADDGRSARWFAQLVDRGDRRLVAYIARRRQDRRALARWAASLPPEALVRLVHLIDPAAAPMLVEAWRLLATSGHAGGEVIASLVALAAGRVGGPRGVLALVVAAAPGEAAAALLRDTLARRAAEAGAAALAAALTAGSLPANVAAVLPQPGPVAATLDPEPTVEPPLDPDQPIFVPNAGLVIAAPYLPALFGRLSLLSIGPDGEPRIEGVDACSRAVHLLQYMADGRLDAPEATLGLNKLLCGMPPGAPVARSWDADPDELAICDGLLAGVIANWPVLGRCSAGALRETFLQREGRLVRRDEDWSLVVQRRGLIDHLRDHIPWPFTTIFHRWMPQPLQVTW